MGTTKHTQCYRKNYVTQYVFVYMFRLYLIYTGHLVSKCKMEGNYDWLLEVIQCQMENGARLRAIETLIQLGISFFSLGKKWWDNWKLTSGAQGCQGQDHVILNSL